MKTRKRTFGLVLALSTVALGAAVAVKTLTCQNVVSTEAAATTKTISEICGFNRVSGQNSKTFIAISGKEVVGTYGATYIGTVFDQTGKELTLKLVNQGGASGSWIGEGTRRFDLKTDDSDFIDGIGSGTTFYITKDTVFEGSDCNIVFGKEYKFTSIYNGGCTITEFAPTTASFAVAEVNNRLSGTQYRVGVNNMSGIAAGFTATYTGKGLDRAGNSVTVSFRDAGSGSTAAGNRMVLIDLGAATTGHILILPQDMVLTSTTDFSKKLVLGAGYRINAATSGKYELDSFTGASDYCAKLPANYLTCDPTGATAPTITGGWSKWAECALALSATEKALIKQGSADANIASFVQTYSYLISKYGYTDYLGLGVSAQGAGIINDSSSNGQGLAIAAVGAVSLAAACGFVFVRKSRRQD